MLYNIIKYAKENKIPIIQDEGLDFLIAKIIEFKVSDILELGSAIGYSAIKMALINENIKVDTIEIDEDRYMMAKDNVNKMNLNNQIKLYHNDALDFESNKQYDLIFLDLAKSKYQIMIDKFYDNLKENGIIVVDNLALYGLVLKKDLKASKRVIKLVEKIRDFRNNIIEDERFKVYFYDEIGDGMGLLIKRKEAINK